LKQKYEGDSYTSGSHTTAPFPTTTSSAPYPAHQPAFEERREQRLLPPAPPVGAPPLAPPCLPLGWDSHIDPSTHATYYANQATGRSSLPIVQYIVHSQIQIHLRVCVF